MVSWSKEQGLAQNSVVDQGSGFEFWHQKKEAKQETKKKKNYFISTLKMCQVLVWGQK